MKQCYKKLTQKDLTNRIHKHQAIFFDHMGEEKLEHLVTNGMVKGKCSRGKQQEKMLDELTNDRCTKSNQRCRFRKVKGTQLIDIIDANLVEQNILHLTLIFNIWAVESV